MYKINSKDEIPLKGVPLYKELLSKMKEGDSVVLPELQALSFNKYICGKGGNSVTRKEGIGLRRIWLIVKTKTIIVPAVVQSGIPAPR